MNASSRSRYHYRIRALNGSDSAIEMEAGPFTPLEASMFGQKEAARKAMSTGEVWVCDYSQIIESDESRISIRTVAATAVVVVLVVLMLWQFYEVIQ